MWTRGRFAGLCGCCAEPLIDDWRARIETGFDEPGPGELPGCEFGCCQHPATVRLYFGRRADTGRLCPGVNYCDGHAEIVRLLFLVEREATPVDGGFDGDICGVTNARGTPCRRPRAPGEETCPTHRAARKVA